MKRVVVTGGTGVTGVALVRYLLSKGIEVIALVRENSSREKYLPKNPLLHIVYCNLGDCCKKNVLLKKYLPIDTFFHLAWDGSTIVNKISSRDDMELQTRNILYAIDAVNLCKEISCKSFIMTGSQAEFGKCNTIINEQHQSLPQNGYGNAKLCAENMTRIMCRNYGIRHVFARLFSVYGPYDGTNSLIYTSILKLLKGESPQYTKGEQIWDYLYSFDAAKALYLLALYGKDEEMYCVANGEADYLYKYIEVIHKIVNKNIIPELGAIPYNKDAVMYLKADINKLKRDTGFKPEISFEDGIRAIRDWCIETGEEYVNL